MDYRYLKAFTLTAKYLSFSKAAAELKIAQSAVSRQVKLLEESMNEELIIRSSKKVILTKKAKDLLKSIEHFEVDVGEIFEKNQDRPIHIGILDGLLVNWFNPILAKYAQNYKRDIYVHVADSPALRRGIEDGVYDMIFSTDGFQSDLTSSLKLFEEKFVIISKEEINKKKLHEYTWIVFSELDHLYKLSKKAPAKKIVVSSLESIKALVKHGVGIAVVPDHTLSKNHKFHTEPITGLKNMNIYMTTLSYKNMPPFLKEFSKILQAN
ncbi:LysR family transcriptional regulator [Halobacteriovorax sp. DPLXC-1]|uniref:LysR family transcriptional regulator n=1 Tax=Halobacteriovorax sp. DPLXC-1 TaxID=3110771 RepID=UPI002FF1A441